MQFIEMAEAEAKFSGTGQIQLEVVPIRRNYCRSFNLSTFICQEKSYEATMVLDFLPFYAIGKKLKFLQISFGYLWY